jgi:hypothetical protein
MTDGYLILEEALPTPVNFPFGPDMESRGFELLIDNLAVQPLRGSTSTEDVDYYRGNRSLRKEVTDV